MKNITAILLFFLCTVCCKSPEKGNLGNKLNEKLYESKTETSLCIFISESMCTECINKEFQNIKDNAELIKSLTVIGAFAQKRHFDACVNTLNISDKNNMLKRLFLNINELKGIELNRSPFYFLYKREANSISEIFYPQPCDIEKTLQFYKKIKTMYQK